MASSGLGISMNLPIEFIRAIERDYEVTTVTVNGVQVWPFLRQVFFFQYVHNVMPGMSSKGVHTRLIPEAGRLRNLAHRPLEWVRTHRYVVLSSTSMRRWAHGYYIDKNAEWLMRELGKQDVLMVETAQDRGGRSFRLSCQGEDTVLSLDPLGLLALLPLGRRPTIVNEGILQEINRKYGFRVDYMKAIVAFFRSERIFGHLLRRWSTECLFLSIGYYGIAAQAAISAAKKKGIPSVELQHGVISKTHEAYNVFRPMDSYAFPDYIFCHGEQAKGTFGDDNYFIPPCRALVVGCGYIEHVRNHSPCDKELVGALAGYVRSVAVSSAETVDAEVIEFVRAAAELDADILYVFIPRRWTGDYMSLPFPSNVVFFPNLDFYHIVKSTDLHATVASSCAVEAPAFGTPNILMNIRGMARGFYGSVLIDEHVTRYADTPGEFVAIARDWDYGTRSEIIARHKPFIRDGHAAALVGALRVVREGAAGREEDSPRGPGPVSQAHDMAGARGSPNGERVT